jgi:hypothetical protein
VGWKERGNGRYYYRSRRVGGRIVTEYCGGAELGELCAWADREERKRKARANTPPPVEAFAEADSGLDELNAIAEELVACALTRAGFHRHDRGEWRRRRAGRTAGDPAVTLGKAQPSPPGRPERRRGRT